MLPRLPRPTHAPRTKARAILGTGAALLTAAESFQSSFSWLAAKRVAWRLALRGLRQPPICEELALPAVPAAKDRQPPNAGRLWLQPAAFPRASGQAYAPAPGALASAKGGLNHVSCLKCALALLSSPSRCVTALCAAILEETPARRHAGLRGDAPARPPRWTRGLGAHGRLVDRSQSHEDREDPQLHCSQDWRPHARFEWLPAEGPRVR